MAIGGLLDDQDAHGTEQSSPRCIHLSQYHYQSWPIWSIVTFGSSSAEGIDWDDYRIFALYIVGNHRFRGNRNVTSSARACSIYKPTRDHHFMERITFA